MSAEMTLKGFRGSATILKSALQPSHGAQDPGHSAVVLVSKSIFEDKHLKNALELNTAMNTAEQQDVVVTTDDSMEGSSCSKVVHVRVLADMLGIDVSELPLTLFRNVAEAECARHPSKCLSQIYSMRDQLHVHFGLGRLAIGLVLPALCASKTHFAIVQRISHIWKDLAEQSSPPPVELQINGEPAGLALQVVSNADHLNSALFERNPLLVLTNNSDMIKQVVRSATSFSCSLGIVVDEVLLPILDHLDENVAECRPILFACENDFGPVRSLSKHISSKVNVVECMVDRVCMSRHIDAKSGIIDVEAEPWEGRMVILEKIDPRLVPFGGNVIIPKDSQSARFLYVQKFSIVNGAHGVLSFMTLRENGVNPDLISEVINKGEMKLLSLNGASDQCREEFKTWQIMRCAYLLSKFDMETIANATGVNMANDKVFNALLEMVAETEKRLSILQDNLSRVMEYDPPRMLAQRLMPLHDFLCELEVDKNLIVKAFIERENIDVSMSKKTISALCEYAGDLCQQYKKDKEKSMTNDEGTGETAPAH
jgi:uncharacterized small protein (DUF1192 family)